MYKDVGKRLLAAILSLCLILGLTDFSVLTVRAEEAGEKIPIARRDIQFVDNNNIFTYDGKEHKPQIIITVNGVQLTEGTDYNLQYPGDMTNILASDNGVKTIQVTGIAGSDYSCPENLQINYYILRRSLERNDNIAVEVEDQNYNTAKDESGRVIPANVTVTDSAIEVDGKPYVLRGAQYTDGMSYDGLDYTYTCSNNMGVGTAAVTITGRNNYEGVCPGTFIIRNNNFEQEAQIQALSQSEIPYAEREEYKPQITVLEKDGGTNLSTDEYDVSYSEAFYQGTTVVRPGEYSATITGKNTYAGSTSTVPYKVIKNIGMNGYADDISVQMNGQEGIPDQVYTGNAIELNGLKVYDKNQLLTEDVDYSLYVSGINAGTDVVEIEGKNCYRGTKIISFRITAGDLGSSTSNVKITFPDEEYIYNGQQHMPEPTVTFHGNVMTKGKDYTVTYGENKNVETGGSITITGKGNLVNSKTVNFAIKPKSINADGISIQIINSGTGEYDGTQKVPNVFVRDGETTLVRGTDYDIAPGYSTAAGTVSIRITGKGNYKDSVTRDFTINKANIAQLYQSGKIRISGITEGESRLYTGSKIKPAVTVNGSGIPVTSSDYTVEYGENTDAGRGQVIIRSTEKGNYTGEITINFNIMPKNISDSDSTTNTITYTPVKTGSYTYCFDDIEPKVRLSYRPVGASRKELVEGTDYTLTYENNRNRGTATIIIKAIAGSNYTGERRETFVIDPLNLSNSGFQLDGLKPYYEFDPREGEVILGKVGTDWSKPGLIYTKSSGEQESISEDDYELSYRNNTAPGNATLIITAKDDGKTSNFTGQTTKPFNIKGNLDEDAEIEIKSPKQVYTGKDITLSKDDIAVTYALSKGEDNTVTKENPLKLGTDYTLSDYQNNRDVGQASFAIKAVPSGNYFTKDVNGKSGSFQIVPKHINNEAISGDDGYPDNATGSANKVAAKDIPKQTYTGQAITPDLTGVFTYNGKTLVENTDFEVTGYTDNTDVGTATITIEGIGQFTGSRELTFEIIPRDISKGTLTIDGLDESTHIISDENDENKLIYTGEPISLDAMEWNFDFTSTDGQFSASTTGNGSAGITMAEDEDYTISFTDAAGNTDAVKSVGMAVITITATANGNYTGTVTKEVMVQGDLRDDNSVEIHVPNSKTYTGADIQLAGEDLEVTYCGATLAFGTDYTLDYAYEAYPDLEENDEFHYNHKDADEAAGFIIKPGSNGRYIGWNAAAFVIEPKPLSSEDGRLSDGIGVKIDEDGYAYAFGDEIKPEPTVTYTYGNNEPVELSLVEGNKGDYTLAWKNNTSVIEEDAPVAEQPTIIITAGDSGNYSGEVEIPFKINPISLDADNTVATYSKSAENEETEESIEIEVKDCKVDYQHGGITFENVTVTYTDEKNREHTLKPSVPEVVGPLDTILVKGDYSISYEGNDRVGTAHLIITGYGNYAQTKRIPFMIMGNLSDGYTEVKPIEPQPYTAAGVTLDADDLVITYDGWQLEAGTDYELQYQNNTDVTAEDTPEENLPTVTIVGKGGFEGSQRTATFTIIPRDLSNPDNRDVMNLTGRYQDGYSYTGLPIEPPESDFTLTDNNLPVETDDYTVSYGENIHGGGPDGKNPPLIIITGTGKKYTGTMEFPFTIIGTPITGEGFSFELEQDSYIYTGSAITPEVTVKHGERTLVKWNEATGEGEYTLEWENNIDVSSADTREGSPTVKVTGTGDYSGTVELTFRIEPRLMETVTGDFTISIPDMTYTGDEVKPVPEIWDNSITSAEGPRKLKENTDYEVVSYSDNVNAGVAAVIIRGIGNYTGEITKEFTIQPQPLDEDTIVNGIVDKVYNTKPQTQQPTVSWKKTRLTEGEDYTLSYQNNTNAGNAVVIISGIGNYSASVRRNFIIGARNITDSSISVEDIANQLYTGSALRPNPVINYKNAKEGIDEKLQSGKDYTLTYAGNNGVGINVATVTINGTGNYTGVIRKNFTITGNMALATVSDISAQNYTGDPIEPAITVSEAGRVLVKGKDYDLEYRNNVNAGQASIIITGRKGSEFGGQKVVNFNIVRDVSSGLEVTGLGTDYLYTGSPIVPTLGKVSAYGTVLTLNRDYKITLTNNVNVGTASMKVEGIGYYSGSKNLTFNIVRRSISQCSVSSVSDKVYNGKAQQPKVTVKYAGKTLVEGTDYSLVYTNNTFPGKASIIINGMGGTNGSQVVNFNIKMPSVNNVKALPSSNTKVKVSWSKQSTADGYQIFNNKNKKVAQVKGANKTSYTISGLKSGTSYKYKVRSYVIRGGKTYYSNFTSLVKVTTKPAAPKISVSSKKAKKAVITWKKVSGATGYEVYRSTKSGSGYKKIKTTKNLTYTNEKLTSNKGYYYKVRAYYTQSGAKIYSSFSAPKYVKIK